MNKIVRRRLATAATTVCTMFIAALVAPGAEATPPPAPAGRDRLPDLVTGHDRPSHGREAVEMLADRLPQAARRNGMATERLREILVEDQSAWLDGDARLFYQDPALTQGATSTTPTAEEAAPAAPLDQTFSLHSKPGSQHSIYLDFNGHDVRDTVWNDRTKPVTSGFHPAWNVDGESSTFNTTEREVVQSVWQRVAADYAPFDVDVTTQDPGAAALTRVDAADLTFGTRALISPSTNAANQLCGGGCGGMAYNGVFDMSNSHAYYQIAWIFPQNLQNSAKHIAEAVSHEVGHTLGLNHDGVTGGTSYYGGHSTWAPIMGVGYGRPITQWSRGDYSGANNHQDDLAVIASNGAPVRPDETGATVTAAAAPPSGSAYITSDSDRDVYNLGVCSGPMTLTANPSPVSPNLDIRISLLTASGRTVTTVAPPSSAGTPSWDVSKGMNATISKDVKSDAYFVSVEGVGNGKPTSGYDGYASIGGYTLSVNGTCHDSTEVPSAPQDVEAAVAADDGTVTLLWAPPASSGTSAISHYVVSRTDTDPLTVTDPSHTFTGLEPGTSYAFTVAAVNATGEGPVSVVQAPVFKPGRTRIDTARSGAKGGRVTAVARWRPPSSSGGDPVSGYRVWGYRLNDRGRVVATVRSAVLDSGARSWQPRIHRGRWKFAVRARNSVGWGPKSVRSNGVTAR